MDRVRDAVNVPWRHVKSFFEPDGQDYQSQMPETSRLYGNSVSNFQAYLTNNSIDMNSWHDMESTMHSQFGTVDNPVLIFTSDASWRIVICMGPGSEEDSHTHEKMYYFIREGPMHRCHLCGQCFKLVRLKDEYSEINDYYQLMFSTIPTFDVVEEDTNLPVNNLFGDRPHLSTQSMPGTNVYIQYNPDEVDHMLVDPAYRMEKMKEAHEKLRAFHMAYKEVDKQLVESGKYGVVPTPFDQDVYENWWMVEKSMRKFDRWFNKIERFESRALLDPVNHERREARMTARKSDRWLDNYTYFFGGLSEEEQMYRDYFETDLEANPELDEGLAEKMDELDIASTGEFSFGNYDFQNMSNVYDAQEVAQDYIDSKIFKYKYRIANDPEETYFRRMDRVVSRSLDRAKARNPEIEANLAELMERDDREFGHGQQILRLLDGKDIKRLDLEGTKEIRKWMLNESVQQYKDYYESDEEENQFFEYLNEIGDREKLRLIEIFEDFTIDSAKNKRFASIPKREFNPELSVFTNLALDLVDFKDRVKPLANDMSLLDQSNKYQRVDAETARQRYREQAKLAYGVDPELGEGSRVVREEIQEEVQQEIEEEQEDPQIEANTTTSSSDEEKN